MKILKAISLATLISIGLVGCAAADLTEDTPVVTDEPEVVAEEAANINAAEDSYLVYENETCGFVLSLPNGRDWMGAEEVVRPSEESTAIYFDIKSTKDPDKKFTILAVRGDHSRYTTPIGATDECVLYVDEAEDNPEIKSITDTFAVVDGSLAEYSNEKANISFKYPKQMHLSASSYFDEEPALYIQLGDESNNQGYIMDTYSFIVFSGDYNDIMEGFGGPYVPHGNACEEELMGFKKVINCAEDANGATTYFALTNFGDLGIGKYYFYEREDENYPFLQFDVSMWTSDFNYLSDFDKIAEHFEIGELMPQQQERINMADSILETLKF